MSRRMIGYLALLAGVALTVALVILIRDFVANEYAGYEVGLQRGAIIAAGILALGAWILGSVLLARSRHNGTRIREPGDSEQDEGSQPA